MVASSIFTDVDAFIFDALIEEDIPSIIIVFYCVILSCFIFKIKNEIKF